MTISIETTFVTYGESFRDLASAKAKMKSNLNEADTGYFTEVSLKSCTRNEPDTDHNQTGYSYVINPEALSLDDINLISDDDAGYFSFTNGVIGENSFITTSELKDILLLAKKDYISFHSIDRIFELKESVDSSKSIGQERTLISSVQVL